MIQVNLPNPRVRTEQSDVAVVLGREATRQ